MSGQFENPMTFVRAMKGAPLSIFVAFLLVQRPMTNEELVRWTGYADDNIRAGLRLLVDLGWVSSRSPRGPWTLADGRQLPLMSGDVFDNPEKIGVEATTTTTLSIGDLKNKLKGSSSSSKTTPKKSGLWSDHQKATWRICRYGGIGEPTRTQIVEGDLGDCPETVLAYILQADNPGLTIHKIRSRDYLSEVSKQAAYAQIDKFCQPADYDKDMP